MVPATAGAYLLLLRLDRRADIILKGRALTAAPGLYVYAGSANGPGGLKARIARHLKPDKTIRWHADRLSVAASRRLAIAVPGEAECRLLRDLLACGRFEVPFAGFGSSDCRVCPAHLLRLRATVAG